MHIS
ncbi:hypothetical protein Zm00014a_022323 [Zea mays]|jgi:hypothetical protein